MRKLIYSVITLGIMAAMVLILMNNKAKSDAKAKLPPTKALAVTVATVSHETVQTDLALVGTIAANREVVVASETQGRVKGVGPDVGDHVSAGSLLARVDDELRNAALTTAQVNYDKAKQDFDRYDYMQKQNDGGIADIQVENARQTVKATEAALVIAKRQYNDTRITAPISGVLTARPVEIGTTLMPGAPVATIVDVSQLKVKVNVPEEDVFKLHNGDRVTITTDVYPGETFEGHVSMIGVKGDEAHTYPVEVTVRNGGSHQLRAGMFGKVNFTGIPRRDVLIIPREALVGSVKKPQVYVVQGKSAKLRDIVVGNELGTNVEVLSGLGMGETIVVNGRNNLRDGVEVMVTNQK
jgi:RND family efflux transporter MFP subunit